MNVIGHASDFKRLHPVLTGNTAQERPESFAQVGWNQMLAFFRTEDTMEIGADVGHAPFSRPFGTKATQTASPNVETLGYYHLSLRDVEPGGTMESAAHTRSRTSLPF